MQLTGNPLVDTGLAIATLQSKRKSIFDLSESDLRQGVSYLNDQLDPNRSKLGALNSLRVLPAFWQNNPLAGHNMGDKKEPYKNVPGYRNVLVDVIQGKQKAVRGLCQICGQKPAFIDVNRSWLPLGASSEGDPCSLPNLSGKNICANCFGAIVLLPLGCKFVGGNPYLFHLTDPALQLEAAENGFSAVRSQLVAKAKDNKSLKVDVKLSGRVALLEVVAGSALWDVSQGEILTSRSVDGATVIAFSNAGTSAAWYQLHLPAQALDFFAELSNAEQTPAGALINTLFRWAKFCEKPDYKDNETKEKRSNPLFDRLCDDIEQRRSLAFLVRAIVERRKSTEQSLKKEEKKVLELYEQVALNKPDRFALLESIADRINAIDERYRRPLLRRLANTRSKDTLYSILVQCANEDKANLRLSRNELRIIYSENSPEVVSLLFLLCVAENEKEK